MAGTIPVPIEFSLPEGWVAAPPEDVGAPDVGFVALRPPPEQGFTPNITISGEIRPEEVALTQVANEALSRLESTMHSVEPGNRNEVGTYHNPGLSQAVGFITEVNGTPLRLIQLQVFLGMRDVRDSGNRAVIEIALSATAEQFADLLDDFQRFVATIAPDGAGA